MIAKLTPILLAALGLVSVSSTAHAQGNTFNPYGNSGYADYREFGSPMVSNNAALPGQALLNNAPIISRPRANSFQDYANDIDGLESPAVGARRGAGSSVPYFQAYQQLNSEYNRVYRPNAKADEGYYERVKARELKYAQAMAERDPVKRAKLVREVERESVIGQATSKSTTKSATNQPKGTTNRSAASALSGPSTRSAPSTRPTAPAERRLTAPSPFSDDRPQSRAPAPPSSRSSTGTTSRARANVARTREESNATSATSGTTAPAPPPR